MTKSHLRIGFTFLSLGAFACSGEPELVEISSTQAALSATENAERALQGVIDAADFLARSTSIAEALGAFGGSDDCETSSLVCDASTGCSEAEPTCADGAADPEELEETRRELREGAQDLVRTLRERFLIEANLESETPTSATYRLGPDALCEAAEAEGPGGEPELDADCVDEVTRLEPRLRLTSPREGDVDMTLLLGAGRHSPLTLALYQQSLGVRVDLGEGLDLARELGEELEELRELSGVLELRLLENAARDYSLELNVLEALSAVAETDEGTLSTSLAESSPAWHVRIDGNSNTLSAGLDLAAFRLSGPLSAFADAFESDAPPSPGSLELGDEPSQPEERSYSGVIELFLAGLSGTVSYTADNDVLSLTNLGFGDTTSTLKHDGNTLLGLDLNATRGRRVDVELRPTETGTELRITPSFELRAALAFEHVKDQFEELSEFLLDDTLRIWFDGDAPAVELSEGALRVSAGTLHVDSAANPDAHVEVEAGMCLVEAAPSASGEDDDARHPLFSLDAGVCPSETP